MPLRTHLPSIRDLYFDLLSSDNVLKQSIARAPNICQLRFRSSPGPLFRNKTKTLLKFVPHSPGKDHLKIRNDKNNAKYATLNRTKNTKCQNIRPLTMLLKSGRFVDNS